MKYFLFIFIITSLIFTACKKTTPSTNEGIDPGLLAHFNFKPGSYWIFIDSVTGSKDSFYVKENNYYSGAATSVRILMREVTTRHDTNSWELDFGNSAWQLNGYSNTRFNSLDNGRLLDIINYPFKLQPTIIGRYLSDSSVINTYSNYTILGNNYPDVWQITDSTHNLAYNHNDCFFISDSAWVIKFSLNHPQDSLYNTWELIRCNIVR